MPSYIYKRGDIYYFRRRVPEYVLPYENRKFVKLSLSTRDEKEAARKASVYNDYIEDYWRSLIKSDGSTDPALSYKATVKLAKAHGFAYKSIAEVAKAPLEEIVERVSVASKAVERPESVVAVLGGERMPTILLSECLDKFWPLCADRLVNKSEHQIRKWKNPRIAALQTFIDIVGDKDIATVTRSDAVNTPPAKAGGFGLRLKAGSIGHSADYRRYTTVKSSSGSGGF